MPISLNPIVDKPPGVILAGGRSSRMGRDKSAIMLRGASLIGHALARLAPQTSRLAVNANAPLAADLPVGIEVFEDTVAGHAGPLAGILAAMRHVTKQDSSATHVATVPTDTPFFPRDLVARLSASLSAPDQVAIAFSGGEMHPVFGLWPLAIADDLEGWLTSDDKRRVRAFIGRHAMAVVPFDMINTAAGPVDPFFNINTPADLERAAFYLPLIEEIEG